MWYLNDILDCLLFRLDVSTNRKPKSGKMPNWKLNALLQHMLYAFFPNKMHTTQTVHAFPNPSDMPIFDKTGSKTLLDITPIAIERRTRAYKFYRFGQCNQHVISNHCEWLNKHSDFWISCVVHAVSKRICVQRRSEKKKTWNEKKSVELKVIWKSVRRGIVIKKKCV